MSEQYEIVLGNAIDTDDKKYSNQILGSVFTNHSLERSLSYSPEFSMYRSI